jgi:uncharacterized protein (DUF1499 family)
VETVESPGGAGPGGTGDADPSGQAWNFDDRPRETPKAGAGPGRGPRRLPGTHVARVALIFGLATPAVAVLGALGAHREVLSSFVGFRMFLISLPLALVGFLFALFARIRARGDRNPSARRKALVATLLGVVTIASVAGLALPAVGFPIINDITTDVDDPPLFVHALTLEANAGRDMSYPEGFAQQQRSAYPTLATVRIAKASVDTFVLARETLSALRDTRVVDEDRRTGRIEAVSISGVFRFKDDVVVRVRETEGGSMIDMRSKSRDGRGDMGVNARRIEDFFALLH